MSTNQKPKNELPTDWDYSELGDYWDVIDCKHITAKFILDGYPVASIAEVQSKFVDLTNAKQTTEDFYLQLCEGNRKPKPGDLIISRNATIGSVAQVSNTHPKFAMGQDVCLLRRRNEIYSPESLQQTLQSEAIGRQISDAMVGSTFKRIPD
ncbi:restriction endonuclease subunit S [Sphaerotilus montanus]|uniref:Restriction endonuclease S subunit n=1 Tax=Sphaerotilus montanus TaxID=522889 RepID=A0A7Y9QZ12_9BURK|nr:restriction endonuclease subunit S [Sphaerotilus montanus]NYG33496.1 restriction endonuclease S subunit [Sphaerotilus montanus]NZD59383.1 restriction endonuclease subunit S [Sphaerotilus montanus]